MRNVKIPKPIKINQHTLSFQKKTKQKQNQKKCKINKQTLNRLPVHPRRWYDSVNVYVLLSFNFCSFRFVSFVHLFVRSIVHSFPFLLNKFNI